MPEKTTFAPSAIVDAKPPRSVFTFGAGAGGRGSGIAIAQDGTVLRYGWIPREERQYEVVGRVGAATLREMVRLAREAAEAPYIDLEGARDAGGVGARFYDRQKQWREVLLAQDGAKRGYRDSPASDTILAWLIAVDREVPAWPVEHRTGVRRKP